MGKVIVYTRPDGGTSVVYPLGMTIQQVLKKDVPVDATDVQIVDAADLPKDRYFREAWQIKAGKVVHDMNKCRQVQMNKIRAARDKRLEELDVDWMKKSAQKKQSDADAVEVERQRLRDLPTFFDMSTASTPEELKALWPDNLPKLDQSKTLK